MSRRNPSSQSTEIPGKPPKRRRGPLDAAAAAIAGAPGAQVGISFGPKPRQLPAEVRHQPAAVAPDVPTPATRTLRMGPRSDSSGRSHESGRSKRYRAANAANGPVKVTPHGVGTSSANSSARFQAVVPKLQTEVARHPRRDNPVDNAPRVRALGRLKREQEHHSGRQQARADGIPKAEREAKFTQRTDPVKLEATHLGQRLVEYGSKLPEGWEHNRAVYNSKTPEEKRAIAAEFKRSGIQQDRSSARSSWNYRRNRNKLSKVLGGVFDQEEKGVLTMEQAAARKRTLLEKRGDFSRNHEQSRADRHAARRKRSRVDPAYDAAADDNVSTDTQRMDKTFGRLEKAHMARNPDDDTRKKFENLRASKDFARGALRSDAKPIGVMDMASPSEKSYGNYLARAAYMEFPHEPRKGPGGPRPMFVGQSRDRVVHHRDMVGQDDGPQMPDDDGVGSADTVSTAPAPAAAAAAPPRRSQRGVKRVQWRKVINENRRLPWKKYRVGASAKSSSEYVSESGLN